MFQIDLIDIFEYANAQITADGSSQKIIIYKEKSYDVIKLYQYSLKIGTLSNTVRRAGRGLRFFGTSQISEHISRCKPSQSSVHRVTCRSNGGV